MTLPLHALPDRKVATIIRNLANEIERLEGEIARRDALAAKPDKAAAEILAACARVGRAVDRMEQSRFAGRVPERGAHRQLESAARELARVMKMHGRMPGGEAP